MIRSHLLKYIGWVSDLFLVAMAMAYLIFIFLVRDQFDPMQLVIFFGLGLIAIFMLGRALFKKITGIKTSPH